MSSTATLDTYVQELRVARQRVVLAWSMVELEAAMRELSARALAAGLALADALQVGDVHLVGAAPAPSIAMLVPGLPLDVAPEPARRQAAPAPPASPGDLARLKQLGVGGARVEVPATVVPSPDLPTPARLHTTADLERAVASLERVVVDAPTWAHLAKADQHAVLSQLAAWGRYLQEQIAVLAPALQERLDGLFPRLTALSETWRPGHVLGLARGHSPRHGSWLADARVAAGMPAQEGGGGGNRPRPRPTPPEIPRQDEASWPTRYGTAGQNVLVVGGDHPRDIEQRWKRAFGFAEVTCVDGSGSRKEQALADSIDGGRFGLVVTVARWQSHSSSDRIQAACKRSGVRRLRMQKGFGVEELRRVLEAAAP